MIASLPASKLRPFLENLKKSNKEIVDIRVIGLRYPETGETTETATVSYAD